MLIFSKKNTDISKIKVVLVVKSIFSEFLKLRMYVYLRTKFQLSSIVLTSFRLGVILPHPHNRK